MATEFNMTLIRKNQMEREQQKIRQLTNPKVKDFDTKGILFSLSSEGKFLEQEAERELAFSFYERSI